MSRSSLRAFQRRLESDSSARQAWVNEWAQEVLRTPEAASIRDWSAALVRRYETGDLRVGSYDDGPTFALIPYKEVPAWLKARRAWIHKDPSGRADGVVLDWYYYGLAVGPTNQGTTFRAWYMTNVAPGVVAYHTGK